MAMEVTDFDKTLFLLSHTFKKCDVIKKEYRYHDNNSEKRFVIEVWRSINNNGHEFECLYVDRIWIKDQSRYDTFEEAFEWCVNRWLKNRNERI